MLDAASTPIYNQCTRMDCGSRICGRRRYDTLALDDGQKEPPPRLRQAVLRCKEWQGLWIWVVRWTCPQFSRWRTAGSLDTVAALRRRRIAVGEHRHCAIGELEMIERDELQAAGRISG